MTSYTVTQARSNLYRLIDQVNKLHKPIHINGKNASAVLISDEDWSAIQETLYLLSIPGMGKSIKEGMKKSLEKTIKIIRM